MMQCAHRPPLYLRGTCFWRPVPGRTAILDHRSSGPLFCLAADEIAHISFAAALEKLQLFLQKLLEEFVARKKEICALVVDSFEGLPAEMEYFLGFAGLMGTSVLKMGCVV